MSLPIIITIMRSFEFVVNEEAGCNRACDVDNFHDGIVDRHKTREEIQVTSQENDSV